MTLWEEDINETYFFCFLVFLCLDCTFLAFFFFFFRSPFIDPLIRVENSCQNLSNWSAFTIVEHLVFLESERNDILINNGYSSSDLFSTLIFCDFLETSKCGFPLASSSGLPSTGSCLINLLVERRTVISFSLAIWKYSVIFGKNSSGLRQPWLGIL